jgi:hypothetical protein
MTDTTHVAADPREDLRRQWLEHAGAVFDRLFPAGDAPTPTFDQLEQRTCNLSTDLAGWLLERRVGAAPEARPAQAALCPRCAQPAQPADDPDEPLPKRVLRSRAGDIELARQRWRCTACRVVFFPPG